MAYELSINPIITFITSKGSRYWLDEIGRSQRYKGYYPENSVDTGLQEIFDYVIYVDDADASHLANATDHRGPWRMVIFNSEVTIFSLDSRNRYYIIAGPFDIRYEPDLGLAPIEIKKLKYDENIDGYIVKGAYHIGNKIVKLDYLYR
jgi:hypothetical protein